LEHKCKENKLFVVLFKDVSNEEVEAPLVAKLPDPTELTLPSDTPKVEPIFSMSSLTRFSSPQTLKLIGYIKN
jgi:hypothetical protein